MTAGAVETVPMSEARQKLVDLIAKAYFQETHHFAEGSQQLREGLAELGLVE